MIKIKTYEQHKTRIKNFAINTEKTNSMNIFKCSCGANILILPDLPEMDRAILAHITEHKRITGQRLSEDIIMQLIIRTITEYRP